MVLVIEGLIWGLFPKRAKEMAAQAALSGERTLMIAGLLAALAGIVLIALVRF